MRFEHTKVLHSFSFKGLEDWGILGRLPKRVPITQTESMKLMNDHSREAMTVAEEKERSTKIAYLKS